MHAVAMPAELADRIEEAKQAIAECHQELADVEENPRFEDDYAELRHLAATIEPLRKETIFFRFEHRTAAIIKPKVEHRHAYSLDAMLVEPPTWHANCQIYGDLDEMVLEQPSPYSTPRFKLAAPMPEGCKWGLQQLEAVLNGLDSLEEANRVRLVSAWGLLMRPENAYEARTSLPEPTKASYKFSNLLMQGPLNANEGELVKALLKTYCKVSASSRKHAHLAHPYNYLRQRHVHEKRDTISRRIEYHTNLLQEAETEWRVMQRKARVERKRAILQSGLSFQAKLAELIAPAGYSCQNFQRKDRGIDLVSHRNGGPRIGIQVKKLQKPVGAAAVRELRGAREIGKYDVVVLVSASGFTRDARKESRVQPAIPLVSLDDLLERLDLGQDPLFLPPGRRRP
jgi:hypothetical protein